MENATKVLLIAAAVLVTIILIAFGMRIFNSTSEVSGQAQTIGKGIQEQTEKATSSTLSSIEAASSFLGGKKIYTAKEFNDELCNILKITPQAYNNSGFYMIQQDRNNSVAIEEMKEIKKLCNQTGRKVQIRIYGFGDHTYDNIDECIARLNETINNCTYGFYEIEELVSISPDSNGYMGMVTYLFQYHINR